VDLHKKLAPEGAPHVVTVLQRHAAGGGHRQTGRRAGVRAVRVDRLGDCGCGGEVGPSGHACGSTNAPMIARPGVGRVCARDAERWLTARNGVTVRGASAHVKPAPSRSWRRVGLDREDTKRREAHEDLRRAPAFACFAAAWSKSSD